ncbi:MAG TPA: enoyl-CoA hydratase/isomerase family protein [Caulobacter sp.]|nr:enoyl-CoA hydratase/isomerase family protein [Caulobacter sp.]
MARRDLLRDEDEVERHAPLFGAPLRIVDLAREDPAGAAGIVVGLDRDGALPPAPEACDLLLTTAAAPPRPWVGLSDLDGALARLDAAVTRHPLAATALVQVLRTGQGLAFEEALVLESAIYSTLLGGEEFRAWRRANPARARRPDLSPRVAFERGDATVVLTLAWPMRRNAFDAAMRDALVEALRAAAADPEVTAIILRGQGPDFSAGGDLDEFGSAPDLAAAHFTRLLRSPARLVRQLAPLVAVRLHGAVIGAGIEAAAAAGRVVAAPGAWFQLPEVGMGLIPGAGGTASIPRRIGRRRAAWMALLGEPLDAVTALDWGLVDALEPAP